MLKKLPVLILCLLAGVVTAEAQFGAAQPPYMERISASEAVDRVLRNNVLTYKGKPFHAVLSLQEEKGDPDYTGRIEIFWANEHQYKLIITSRSFDQTLIVHDEMVEETDRGDFYPRWLQSFVLALLDPLARLRNLAQSNQNIAVGDHLHACLKRDDRPGGITDQMTWGQLCFADEGPHLDSVIDFTYNMEFHDFRSFGKKQVARTYIAGEGDHARIRGTLTTLEALKQGDDGLFIVAKPTDPSQRLVTTFVSTAKEEAMIEHKPDDVVWPPVREGKIEGFMIVHAVTDRTGQVRETSKHNSDNPELESYGRLVALRYKFAPLLINGVPQQMEMPLVLHFSTKLGIPLPEFSDVETRSKAINCNIPREVTDPHYAGKKVELLVTISEEGKVNEVAAVNDSFSFPLYGSVRDCHFSIVEQNGKPTKYKGHISALAK